MLVWAVLLITATVVAHDARAANRYDATFEVQPNGDAKVSLMFSLPMREYTRLRSNGAVLQVLTRDLANASDDAEIRDQNAQYNDAERSVSFSLRALGLAYNAGTHWEVEVDEDRVFSNLNRAENSVYFTPNIEGEMGEFQGKEVLVLPATATDIEWDKGKRVVRYTLPAPKSPASGGKTAMFVIGGLLVVAGLAVVGASCAGKSSPDRNG